jgi:MYXO-CTERM domain-containing protein
MADDGLVVFESAYTDANGSGFAVFFRLPNSSTLERLEVPFPGMLTGTEICCDLVGVDSSGIVGVVGSRDGEQYLFVGKPTATSLALTVPIDGLDIPNAPGFFVPNLDIPATSMAVGRGGSFVWVSNIGVLNPVGFTWAVVSYEAGVGLRLLAKQGDPTPDGGEFGGNFSQLSANGNGGFQFTVNTSVYRASRQNDDITLERLGGPGDAFVDAHGTMVTATQVDSQLDSRAFAAGRVALTVYYTDPATQSSEWMTLVDGTPPPPPPDKSGRCQVGDSQPGGALLGVFGLLLLGVSRRRARA